MFGRISLLFSALLVPITGSNMMGYNNMTGNMGGNMAGNMAGNMGGNMTGNMGGNMAGMEMNNMGFMGGAGAADPSMMMTPVSMTSGRVVTSLTQ